MASITILLEMAGMHSQYYHINITSGLDAQPALPYKYYAGMHGQYYHINIINGWDAQPVLPHEYHMSTQSKFFQQLGHAAILNDVNFSHNLLECTAVFIVQ